MQQWVLILGVSHAFYLNGPYLLLVRTSYFILFHNYTLDLLPQYLSFANGAGGVNIF